MSELWEKLMQANQFSPTDFSGGDESVGHWGVGAWNDFRRSENIDDRRSDSSLTGYAKGVLGSITKQIGNTNQNISDLVNHPLSKPADLIRIPPTNVLADQAGASDLTSGLQNVGINRNAPDIEKMMPFLMSLMQGRGG